MKVLFSFVGHRDPAADLANGKGEGAIVTAARRFGVDAAVLWFVKGGQDPHSTTEPEAGLTAEYLTQHVRPDMQVELVKLPVDDPTDYAGLLQHVRLTLQDYLRDKADVESVVSVSSGTPQQQVCLLMLAAGGAFPNATVVEVKDPRFVPEEQRVRVLTLTFLEEEHLVAAAIRHARQGLFVALSEDLQRIAEVTLHPDRRRIAAAWAELAQAYAAWDRFDYPQAQSILSRALARHREALGAWAQRVAQQQALLGQLRGACGEQSVPPTRAFLADGFWNAQRCLSQGRYVDALVRAWRLIEGAAVARLWEHHGVDVLSPARSRSQQALAQVQAVAQRLNVGLRHQLTLYGALEALRDPKAQAFLDDTVRLPLAGSGEALRYEEGRVRDLLDRIRDTRNRTPAAHGSCPVDAGLATGALRLAERALREVAGVDVSKAAHPLADLDRLAQELADQLR